MISCLDSRIPETLTVHLFYFDILENATQVATPVRQVNASFKALDTLGNMQEKMYGHEQWTKIVHVVNQGLCWFLLRVAEDRMIDPTNPGSMRRYNCGQLSYACYWRYVYAFRLIARMSQEMISADRQVFDANLDAIASNLWIGKQVVGAIRRFQVDGEYAKLRVLEGVDEESEEIIEQDEEIELLEYIVLSQAEI
jgi:hypothetical protein